MKIIIITIKFFFFFFISKSYHIICIVYQHNIIFFILIGSTIDNPQRRGQLYVLRVCPSYKVPKKSNIQWIRLDSADISEGEKQKQEFEAILESFKSCQHLTTNETVNVGTWGCNPYLYTNDANEVHITAPISKIFSLHI